MKTFILHWNNGHTEKVSGSNIVDAFRRKGLRSGMVHQLHHYEEAA